VLEHFDLLLTHDVKVEHETLLRIRHNLIAVAGADDRRDRPGLFASRGACAVPPVSGCSTPK
jgi:hypothetical protein